MSTTTTTFNLYQTGDIIRAHYDLRKFPQLTTSQHEIVAFIKDDKLFCYPELTPLAYEELQSGWSMYQLVAMEAGVEEHMDALCKGFITIDECLARIFTHRAIIGRSG